MIPFVCTLVPGRKQILSENNAQTKNQYDIMLAPAQGQRGDGEVPTSTIHQCLLKHK